VGVLRPEALVRDAAGPAAVVGVFAPEREGARAGGRAGTAAAGSASVSGTEELSSSSSFTVSTTGAFPRAVRRTRPVALGSLSDGTFTSCPSFAGVERVDRRAGGGAVGGASATGVCRVARRGAIGSVGGVLILLFEGGLVVLVVSTRREGAATATDSSPSVGSGVDTFVREGGREEDEPATGAGSCVHN
jgi:hypothetical protein